MLSVPRRRPMDETQETLRTSAFPSTHVKDKWAKNLYIAGKSLRPSLQTVLCCICLLVPRSCPVPANLHACVSMWMSA